MRRVYKLVKLHNANDNLRITNNLRIVLLPIALRHLVSTNEDADVTRMANGALSILDGRHTQAAQQTVARGTAQRHNSGRPFVIDLIIAYV